MVQFVVDVSQKFLFDEHRSLDGQIDAFKMGFIDGWFKLQPRAQSNCITEGVAYVKALKEFLYLIFRKHFMLSDQDQFNFDDLTVNFFHKCTITDTIIGTTLLNGAIYTIDAMPPSISQYFNRYRWMFRMTDAFGLFNAVVELGYWFNVGMFKRDYFNKGRIVAKMSKMYIQWHLW